MTTRPKRMPRLSRGVKIVFLACAAAIGAMILIDYLTPVSPQDRLRALRREVNELRTAADSCRSALADEESRLLASDANLDSLRQRIARFEQLDPRGVPADSYDIYMKTFNSYNSRIPGRTFAGESLKAHWEACRAITERHNRVADSAKTLADSLGLLKNSPVRIPVPEARTPDREGQPGG